MTQAQEQKLLKYLQLQDHLSRNPCALDDYPDLKPLYGLFNQRLLHILKTQHMIDECVEYKSLREELVKSAASFCRKITSFALLEEISELQGMCFTSKELMDGDDPNLIKTCQSILTKSEDFQKDLNDYGIDSDAILSFREHIDRFKAVLCGNSLTNQTQKEFSRLFKETDEIFEGKLENIILENIPKS
jgi:hypothetical protein